MATPISTKFKTDWRKCCLCQQEKKEELKSPHTNPAKTDSDGYTNIATNIPQFRAINALPIVLDPSRLDDGEGIDHTLRKHDAKYHQSCRLLLSNSKLERAKKRASSTQDEEKAHFKKQKRASHSSNLQCFLCDKEDKECNLRKAMTMNLNEKINKCAKTLNDGKLLAKLIAGDVVAQEFKYHPACLAALYNRERAHLRAEEQSTSEGMLPKREAYAIAFSELVTHITETKLAATDNSPVMFKLAELVKLYEQRLQQLGVLSADLNSTRLKEQLLLHVPEVQTYQEGRDVYIVFYSDIGAALGQKNTTSDAMHLAKAASIIRKDMLAHRWILDKTLEGVPIEESIPSSLLEFVSMIEHGGDIKSQLRYGASKSDLALAQLLQYNCSATYKEQATTHRHSKDRETPLPVYMGLTVFSKNRKRQLIDMLHENGLGISYDRVLEISALLGEAVVNQYVEDGVVCPPILKKGLFTSSAMDNIDHNPSATTAHTSFHGTSISIFQHPSSANIGEKRGLNFGNTKIKRVPELPETFTNIPPAYLQKNPKPTATPDGVQETVEVISRNPRQDYGWLEMVSLTQEVNDNVSIAWSGYHASQKRGQKFEVSTTSLLPILRDKAHSVATIKHVMGKISETTEFLNPGQTPVVAADQPLYALAKQIQWQWPEEYGEDKFVIMLGGLHIEMAALRSIGTILQESGWVSALAEAGVASSGTSESFLTASSVTKTRQAHQVTACSLYKLMKLAYNNYTKDVDSNTDVLYFEAWCDERRAKSPQFCFWHLIMTMELEILELIRSFREGDFNLYHNSLTNMLPYFFANNNINYARWIPVHLRDMISIEQQHPRLAEEFHKGNFVVHKSEREFSGIAIDQAHEQNNAVIKGEGGAIGLTEDEAALRRWMVAGPEVSRFVSRYEELSGLKDANSSRKHHEDSTRYQQGFLEKVNNLTEVLKEMGNPFEEESSDLLTLDTKDIAHPNKSKLVATHHKKGKEQFQAFMKTLQSESFYEPIKKNDTAFFKQQPAQSTSKEKTLKQDCQLFSRLFISCQSRGCDLDEFFHYENQLFPASLSDNGSLYTCQKSHLIEELEAKVSLPTNEPKADAIIIDGAGMVNTIRPGSSKTFDEYANYDILPKVYFYSKKYARTDLVFDVYRASSLKNETRSSRGKGVRRRVTATTKAPKNWKAFLRDNNNKTELFNFLADKIFQCDSMTNTVIVTNEEDVVSNKAIQLDDVAPCTHEEADTRMFVHARSVTLQGAKSLIVKANDTDVVVVAVAVMPSLREMGLEFMWITFGNGVKLRWIPIHELVDAIGPVRSRGLSFFHAFTGCDVVSAFRGKGNKSAWQTWSVCNEEVSCTFTTLSEVPSEVSDHDLAILEKFVVSMYDRSSKVVTVNEARLDLFARIERSYQGIPPTRTALHEHAKRAAYQAGVIWGQATDPQPEILSPESWGWRRKGDVWQIHWTELPPIASSCQELTKCGCKKQCSGRCKCYRCGLVCTRLCGCNCQV